MKFYVFVYCLAGIVKKKILFSIWVKVIIYAGDVDFKWRWLLSSCKSGSKGGLLAKERLCLYLTMWFFYLLIGIVSLSNWTIFFFKLYDVDFFTLKVRQ